MTDQVNSENQVNISLDAPLSTVLQEVERVYLGHVMTKAGGNKVKAAEMAGVARDTFRKKVDRYTVKAVFTLG